AIRIKSPARELILDLVMLIAREVGIGLAHQHEPWAVAVNDAVVDGVALHVIGRQDFGRKRHCFTPLWIRCAAPVLAETRRNGLNTRERIRLGSRDKPCEDDCLPPSSASRLPAIPTGRSRSNPTVPRRRRRTTKRFRNRACANGRSRRWRGG